MNEWKTNYNLYRSGGYGRLPAALAALPVWVVVLVAAIILGVGVKAFNS